jgi:acetolactate synthase-1/2/3 large subunit
MVFHGHKQVYGTEAPWDTPWIDFAGWAQSLGLPAARVSEPGQITRTKFETLLRDGPAVLDIRIDRSQRVAGGGRNEALQHMSMAHEAAQ